MAAPGSEQATIGITKWACRGEWRERLDVIIDAHFSPVLSLVDLPVEDLPEILGDAFSPLFACVLEDFLTCDFGPDQRSIVADYLKRRGYRERAPVKTYLRALQRSVMSIYQVVLAAPGGHAVLRDLIRGGDPIRVEDAARLAGSDRIAARLLPVGGKTWLAGGMLDLSARQATDLVKDIRRLRQRLRRWMAREAEQSAVRVADIEAVIPLDDVLLGELAPIFTHVWLTATLEQRLGLVLADAGSPLAPSEEAAPEALLSMPLTALDGKSPQQAARSQTGRRQLAQWLKYQESRDPEQVGSDPDVAGADLGWMWQALKIGHLR